VKIILFGIEMKYLGLSAFVVLSAVVPAVRCKSSPPYSHDDFDYCLGKHFFSTKWGSGLFATIRQPLGVLFYVEHLRRLFPSFEVSSVHTFGERKTPKAV